MTKNFLAHSVEGLLAWARANSLWFTVFDGGCCSHELLNTLGCRYDLERFGCLPQRDPRQCDLLLICGAVTERSAPELKALYDAMPSPKYVIALGSCANVGGPFSSGLSYSVLTGAHQVIPVDIYVPGCPPRPEAIMNGLIALQEKISG